MNGLSPGTIGSSDSDILTRHSVSRSAASIAKATGTRRRGPSGTGPVPVYLHPANPASSRSRVNGETWTPPRIPFPLTMATYRALSRAPMVLFHGPGAPTSTGGPPCCLGFVSNAEPSCPTRTAVSRTTWTVVITVVIGDVMLFLMLRRLPDISVRSPVVTVLLPLGWTGLGRTTQSTKRELMAANPVGCATLSAPPWGARGGARV